jgi:hypothetical protein
MNPMMGGGGMMNPMGAGGMMNPMGAGGMMGQQNMAPCVDFLTLFGLLWRSTQKILSLL